MAVMAREVWTDGRLDDLNHRVDEGFKEMCEEFRAIRGEIASMSRTLIQTMVCGFVAMGVGFAGTVATVILTST